MKKIIVGLSLVLSAAVPLFAQEPPPPEPEQTEGSEAAGKVDALGEAFTEIRNIVEALNRLKLSGYIQAQYVHDETSANELSGAAATRNRDQFSVRRARVKFTYQATKTSRFVLQPDVASSGVTLKDGYVEFTEPWTGWHHTLTAGQFNWPFGFEIGYSSSDRELPERSRVVRTLFPGERDRGVQFSGLGLHERFSYKLAIVNGTGTTQSFDFNKRKDVVGRAGGSLGPLDVGVSIYRGSELVSVAGNAAGLEFDRRREGIDFQLVTPIRGLGVRGEYIRGRQPPASGVAAPQARAADVEGYYLYAIQNLGTHHQFAVRYDAYDPDRGNDLADTVANAKVATLGASYIFHWDAHSKVMAAYEKPKTDGFADPDDDLFTLRYQFKF
ncbi:MAG TPA: porin [Thermoanaerobaculia bacterium]|nr:porin [Thermoanaerobaculia bacterium]